MMKFISSTVGWFLTYRAGVDIGEGGNTYGIALALLGCAMILVPLFIATAVEQKRISNS